MYLQIYQKVETTMNLKSIRENYSNLLAAFSDAGIKLNESQKSNLDSFILSLESAVS